MFARRRILGWLRNSDGTAAVELAFCLPVLLTMLFGFVQFGLVQHDFSSVKYAMQRSGRALVINPNLDVTALQAIVDNKLGESTRARTTIALSKTTTANGIVATITGTYTAEFGIPNLASFTIPYRVTVTEMLPA